MSSPNARELAEQIIGRGEGEHYYEAAAALLESAFAEVRRESEVRVRKYWMGEGRDGGFTLVGVIAAILDPDSKMLYLRMLEAAHRESGRYQTIIVTHSRELQAMVERTIDVTTLGPRELIAEELVA